jgi:hypothetical protein
MSAMFNDPLPDLQFFAVRINERNGEDMTALTGDFIELNTEALRSSIEIHSVSPDRIELTMKDGSTNFMDMADYIYLSERKRSQVSAHETGFSYAQSGKITNNYSSFVDANKAGSTAVGPEEFFSQINAAFMDVAANVRPNDMFRISNDAAKEILARGDADVYKLTPSGPEKLSAFEAMRPLCFAEYNELAIKRADVSALDKWAHHAVKNAMHLNRREEQKKSRDAEI